MKTTDRTWIHEKLGEAAYAALADGLAASELWSLLLDVLERRALQRAPAAVATVDGDPFTRPAA